MNPTIFIWGCKSQTPALPQNPVDASPQHPAQGTWWQLPQQ